MKLKSILVILLLLAALLVVAACTSSDVSEDAAAGAAQTEDAAQTDDAAHDAAQEVPDTSAGDTVTVAAANDESAEPAESAEPVEAAAAEPKELSLAEKYLAEFNEKVNYYDVWYTHPTYGAMIIWWFPDFTKYIMKGNYVEYYKGGIAATPIKVNSDYIIEHEEELRDGERWLMDYIWVMGEGTLPDDELEISGCLIEPEDGGVYTKDSCLWNTDKDAQIIHEGFAFDDRPKLPQQWLEEFIGQEPVEIRASRQYKDNSASHVVDQVYYDNGDGTETLLYVDKGYKMPLRVEILKDRKVQKAYVYESVEFNKVGFTSWKEDFFKV